MKHKWKDYYGFKYDKGDIIVDKNFNNILLLKIENLLPATNSIPYKRYNVSQLFWQTPLNSNDKYYTKKQQIDAYVIEFSTELASEALKLLYLKEG